MCLCLQIGTRKQVIEGAEVMKTWHFSEIRSRCYQERQAAVWNKYCSYLFQKIL